MTKTQKRIRLWGRILFILYLLCALYVMFFSESLDRELVSDTYRYNLTLFKEIKRFWNMRYTYGWNVTLINLVGNVVCCLPFGFLLPTISRKPIFKNIITVTIWVHLTIHLFQQNLWIFLQNISSMHIKILRLSILLYQAVF